MTEKLRAYIAAHRELIVYVIVGGCTSVIGMGGYWLLVRLGLHPVPSNVISWVFAVIFAFYANKYVVFRNSSPDARGVVMQFIAFVAARLFSLGVETLLIWLGIDTLGIDKYLVKIPVAVLVVVLNYITGKFLVFAKRKRH